MDSFIDHRRLERDFPHLVGRVRSDEADDNNSRQEATDADGKCETVESSPVPTRGLFERQKGIFDDEDDLAPEDMPVTVVVKADSANTLASILDALGDWGDVEDPQEISNDHFEEISVEGGGRSGERSSGGRETHQQRREWGEGDLQHKQRRRLLVDVAHSGVGVVTFSDVRLARDCECPVFAHNVRADATAARELRRVGGGVVAAVPEAAAVDGVDGGVGGEEGFIGRAGVGKECVVVSETVGELLGEIERFVLRVR